MMMYPLVRETATTAAPHRVPVAVTCRVLNLPRQPYYRWLASPVTDTNSRRHTGQALCSTCIATTLNSATASSSRRPVRLASR